MNKTINEFLIDCHFTIVFVSLNAYSLIYYVKYFFLSIFYSRSLVISLHSMVIVSKTQNRTGNCGTKDFGEFIRKAVAVVFKKIVNTECAFVFHGTYLDAVDTQVTVSSYIAIRTSSTFCTLTNIRYASSWVY